MRYYGVGEFIDAHCTLDPRGLEPAKNLWRAYAMAAPAWQVVMTKRRFGQTLRKMGFTPYRTNSTRYWRGLSL